MKKIQYLILTLFILSIIPTTSYALFDAGMYGGYSMYNKIHDNSNFIRPYGWKFGFSTHYNLDIVPKILNFGTGIFYQMNIFKYEENNTFFDYERHVIAIDSYLMLEMDIAVHPFIRFSCAIWEKDKNGSNYFQSFYPAVGLEFQIFWKFRLYAEYEFNLLVKDSDKNDLGHTINFGIRYKTNSFALKDHKL